MAILDANKQIVGLKPYEVSLVGRPANKRRALLFKSVKAVDASEAPFELTDEQRAFVRERLASVAPAIDKLINKSVRQLSEVRKDDSIEGAEDLGWDATTQSIMAGVGRIASQLIGKVKMEDWQYLLQQVGFAEEAEEDEAEDPDDNADEQQENEIGGGYVVVKDEGSNTNKEGNMADSKWEKPDGVDQKTHDQAKAAAMALYNSKVKGGDKTEKDADGDEDAEGEDMEKGKKTKSQSEPASVDERMTQILKAQKNLEEQNRKLAEDNAKMERQLADHTEYRVTKSIKETVDAQLRHLGGDQAKVVRVIKHMRGLEDKTLEEDLMQVLKSCDAQLQASMNGGGSHFQSTGMTVSDSGDTALAQIEALVDAHVQKSDSKMSRQVAYDKVMNSAEGRALYAKHRKEKGQV